MISGPPDDCRVHIAPPTSLDCVDAGTSVAIEAITPISRRNSDVDKDVLERQSHVDE
jgi:hypothetical protein